MTRYQFQDVLDNVQAFMEGTSGGSAEPPDILRRLYPQFERMAGDDRTRLSAQVNRALRKLADHGRLVRRRVSSTQVIYYTPAAWAAAEQAGRDKQEEAKALDERWQAVWRRREALLGITQPGGGLLIGEWERLLDLAQKGADRG